MSRHHILPPIVYTPAPPKPKKTERRPKTSSLQKSGVAASDEAGEAEETGEVFVAGTHGAGRRSGSARPVYAGRVPPNTRFPRPPASSAKAC